MDKNSKDIEPKVLGEEEGPPVEGPPKLSISLKDPQGTLPMRESDLSGVPAAKLSPNSNSKGSSRRGRESAISAFSPKGPMRILSDLPIWVKVLGVLVFFSIPFIFKLAGLASGRYWLEVLNTVGLYAILALSLNVILGHAGMFNMGHAAFFAIGSYTTAILNTSYGWRIFYTFPVAGFAAGLFAYIVARPIIHLRGDYLLIVTIGIVEIIRIALINDIFGLTGGPNGLMGISRPYFFGLRISQPIHFFYLIWISVAITVLLFHFLEFSRFGRALKFIKEDTVAAEGIGIDTSHYKLMAFVIGATFAGFAGTIYSARMGTISPESFSFGESVILFTIVILGGSGSQRGVILGSFLVMGLPEIFRGFQNFRLLIFGAALVGMMIFRPQGLIPPKGATYVLPEPWANIKGQNGEKLKEP